MEQNLHSKGEIDFRQYDRVWQRVLPVLSPWGAGENLSCQNGAESVSDTMPLSDAACPVDSVSDAACTTDSVSDMEKEPESLTSLLEEELWNRRQLLALAQRSPVWGRQPLRDAAVRAGERAKRLSALHYLLTGETYAPALCVDQVHIQHWLPALRERCQGAARISQRYARAAERTTDHCSRRLLEEMSAAAYQNAAALIRLLERSLSS